MLDVLLPFSVLAVFIVFAYLNITSKARGIVPGGYGVGGLIILLVVSFVVTWVITNYA